MASIEAAAIAGIVCAVGWSLALRGLLSAPALGATDTEINKYYADAIKGYQGNWVPSVVMGEAGGSRVAGSGAQQLIDLLTAKTAKEFGLDMGVSGATKTKK